MNWSILCRSKTKRYSGSSYGSECTQEINTHNQLLVFVTNVRRFILANQVRKDIVSSAVDILYSWIALLPRFWNIEKLSYCEYYAHAFYSTQVDDCVILERFTS